MRQPARPSLRKHPGTRALLFLAFALHSVPAAAQDALDEPPSVSVQGGTARSPAEQLAADEKARARFEKGRAAFKDGHYRDAWEHFREAYVLSQRPELLYNVGQSADRMRMDREAVAAFKLYLQRLPNADNRKEVESRIIWLEDRLRREGEAPPTTLDDSTDGDFGARPPAPETTPDNPELDAGPEPPVATTPGAQPTRSGWYVRLALGLGVLADSLGDSATESLGSITASGLLSLGYTLDPGLVLAGGIAFDWGLAPSARNGDNDVEIETANLTLLVAFVDYFLAPTKNGWHVLGGLGIGALSLSDRTATIGIEDATGGALMVGGGYEWPLDKEWAIGVLGRFIVGRMSTDTAKHTFVTPSVAFNATWY